MQPSDGKSFPVLHHPAADWLIRLAIVLAMYVGSYAAQAGEWFRGVSCAA